MEALRDAMYDGGERIFLLRVSLKSFLLMAYKKFTENCQWMFQLYLCRRAHHHSLELRTNQEQLTFLRAVKPWLHVGNMICVIVNVDGLVDERIDCLQILTNNVGAENATRIKTIMISTSCATILNSLANIFAKCQSIKAIQLSVTDFNLGSEITICITDLLALPKLRELTLYTLGSISSNSYNVDIKNLSSLRILRIMAMVGGRIMSEGRGKFLKGLTNLNTINIRYEHINAFARDSYIFGDLIDVTVNFGYKPLLNRTISIMPAVKKLKLTSAAFQWQTLVKACPRVQILSLINCEITGPCDNSHALCLTKLYLQKIIWHARGWHKSSFIGQMTASVLQYFHISHGIGYQNSVDNPQSEVFQLMGQLRKLKEDPRLLANCATWIVGRGPPSLSTTFITARHDRIRVFLFRHTYHMHEYK